MEEIYHAATSVDIPQRQALVTERSDGDVVLRDEVLSMLVSDELVADFLQEPVVELSLMALTDETLRETEIISQSNLQSSLDLTGQLLAGRYKVIKKLGGGGFGDVFKASDTKVMSRPVVIKVLLAGVITFGVWWSNQTPESVPSQQQQSAATSVLTRSVHSWF
jgi:hypothetical protein